MNVLLVHNDSATTEAVTFALEAKFDLMIRGVKSARETIDEIEKIKANRQALLILKAANSNDKAVNLLNQYSSIEAIIVEESVPFQEFYAYRNNEKHAQTDIEIPIIMICKVLPDDKQTGQYYEQGVVECVAAENVVEDLINVFHGMFADLEQDDSEFCPILLPVLRKMSPLKNDVYIKLSHKKYVKLVKAGDNFDNEDLQKYSVQKKVERLYVKKEAFEEVLHGLTAKLDKLVTQENVDRAEAIEVIEDSLDTIQQIIQKTGFTPKIQAVAKQNVELAKKTIGKAPKLSAILSGIEKNKNKYIGGHSMALAEVACGLAAMSKWTSETTFTKLTTAALFHDITINKNKLAEIQTLEELEERKEEFSKEDIDNFKIHPIAAADIIKQFKEITSDVDTIVLQHHELPDGTGFPRKLVNRQIMPLSALFIVAHDIVSEMYREDEEDFSMEQYFVRSQGKFSGSNFRDVIKTLDPSYVHEPN